AGRMAGGEQDAAAVPAHLTDRLGELLQSLDAGLGGDRVHALDEFGIGPQTGLLDHEREHGVIVPVAGEFDAEVELALLGEEAVVVWVVVLSRGGVFAGGPCGIKGMGERAAVHWGPLCRGVGTRSLSVRDDHTDMSAIIGSADCDRHWATDDPSVCRAKQVT